MHVRARGRARMRETQKRVGRWRASLQLLVGFVGSFIISLAGTSDRKSLKCSGSVSKDCITFNIWKFGRDSADNLLCFLLGLQ